MSSSNWTTSSSTTPHLIVNAMGRTYVRIRKHSSLPQLNHGRSKVCWCFIMDLLMQHKFCCVDLIGRSWRTWKTNWFTPTYLACGQHHACFNSVIRLNVAELHCGCFRCMACRYGSYVKLTKYKMTERATDALCNIISCCVQKTSHRVPGGFGLRGVSSIKASCVNFAQVTSHFPPCRWDSSWQCDCKLHLNFLIRVYICRSHTDRFQVDGS